MSLPGTLFQSGLWTNTSPIYSCSMLTSAVQSVAAACSLDGPIMSQYLKLAQATGLWLSLGGFQEACPSDPKRLQNCHVVVDGKGVIVSTYRKVHLFDVEVFNGPVLKETSFTAPGREVSATYHLPPLPPPTPQSKPLLGARTSLVCPGPPITHADLSVDFSFLSATCHTLNCSESLSRLHRVTAGTHNGLCLYCTFWSAIL